MSEDQRQECLEPVKFGHLICKANPAPVCSCQLASTTRFGTAQCVFSWQVRLYGKRGHRETEREGEMF